MNQIVPLKSSFVPKVLRTPSWVIVMKMEEYNPSYDDLEPWMYEPYPRVPVYYTTLLYGRRAQRCRPSEAMIPIFNDIKYGEGLNEYWRVNWWDKSKRKNKLKKTGKDVGKLTKEECKNKGNHGNYVSTEELIERAKGKGETAWNARRYLKRRGYVLVSGEWVLQQ